MNEPLEIEFLLIIGAVYAWLILKQAHQIRGETAGPNAFHSVEPDPDFKSTLDLMIQDVEVKFLGAYLERPTIVASDWASRIFLYTHSSKPLYLWFSLSPRGAELRVAVLRRSGERVEEIPQETDSWRKTWEDASAGLADEPNELTSDEAVQMVGRYTQDKAADMIACYTVPSGDRRKLSWWSAIRLVLQSFSAKAPGVIRTRDKKLVVATRSPLGEPDDDNIGHMFSDDELSARLDLIAYERLQMKKASRKSWWWLPLSLMAFMVSFSFLMDVVTALILAGVIFLHEIGHWAAMRVFGYENTRFFFLPFFGGAAVGRKKSPELHQVMLVLLAGPVPGLILATVITGIWNPPLLSWQGLSVMMLWVINALNLLPIVPLDGGKIVQTLLFSKRPWAEMAFYLSALVLAGWSGWSSGDFILKTVFVVLLLGASHNWKQTKIAEAIRSQVPHGAPPDIMVAREIYRRYPETSHYPTRLTTLGQIFPRVSSTPAGWGGLLGWLSLYLVCLVGGSVCVPLVNYLSIPTELVRLTDEGYRSVVEYREQIGPDGDGFEVLREWFEKEDVPENVERFLSGFGSAAHPQGMKAALEFEQFDTEWEQIASQRDKVRQAHSRPLLTLRKPSHVMVERDLNKLTQILVIHDLEKGRTEEALQLLAQWYGSPQKYLFVEPEMVAFRLLSLNRPREFLRLLLTHYQFKPAEYEMLLNMQRAGWFGSSDALVVLDLDMNEQSRRFQDMESTSKIFFTGNLRHQYALYGRSREEVGEKWPIVSDPTDFDTWLLSSIRLERLKVLHDIQTAGFLVTSIKLHRLQTGRLPTSLSQLSLDKNLNINPERWSYSLAEDSFQLSLQDVQYFPYVTEGETKKDFTEEIHNSLQARAKKS